MSTTRFCSGVALPRFSRRLQSASGPWHKLRQRPTFPCQVSLLSRKSSPESPCLHSSPAFRSGHIAPLFKLRIRRQEAPPQPDRFKVPGSFMDKRTLFCALAELPRGRRPYTASAPRAPRSAPGPSRSRTTSRVACFSGQGTWRTCPRTPTQAPHALLDPRAPRRRRPRDDRHLKHFDLPRKFTEWARLAQDRAG